MATVRRGFVFTGGAALGALDVGVLHALTDAGLGFELMAGQGSGGVNAAAVCAGVDPHQLGQLWLERAASRPGWICRALHPLALLWRGGGIFRVRRDLWRLPRWRSLLDLAPLARALALHVPEPAVRQSATRLVLLAWNLDEGELASFGNDWYLSEHALASASLPHLFPPVEIERQRYCDPTLLAETSPLVPVALGETGLDELYFPMPRLRPEVDPAGRSWQHTLVGALLTSWRLGLERDLQALSQLPEGRVPRLVPIEFEAQVPALGPVDYSRGTLHRLLDTGYDATRALDLGARPAPASPPAKAPPRRRKPVTRRGAVTRLKEALRKPGAPPRREPELGF